LRRPIESKVRATISDFGVASPLRLSPPEAREPKLAMTDGGLAEALSSPGA
jgi:hypothetical protein